MIFVPDLEFVMLDPAAKLPEYKTAGAAGADVYAVVNMVLMPGQRGLVRTGLGCRISAGYELQVRPRSGLALKNGVTVLNTPGTVDGDYQGELSVNLVNLGNDLFYIDKGDRIAQIVIAPIYWPKAVRWVSADAHEATERGAGGFGSTGVK